MEQPNYPAVERLYTLFKFLVLSLLIGSLFSLLYQNNIFGLFEFDVEEVNTSEVVKSDGFADGIVPAGDTSDEEEDEPVSTAEPTPTLRSTIQAPSTPTPATASTSSLIDETITWDSAMIDAGFELLTLSGVAPYGESIRVLLDNEVIDGVEIYLPDVPEGEPEPYGEWTATTAAPSSGTHTVLVELLDDGEVVKRFQRELQVPDRP